MRKKNLFTTMLAAVFAVVMINAVSGCGTQSGQPASSTSSQSSADPETKSVSMTPAGSTTESAATANTSSSKSGNTSGNSSDSTNSKTTADTSTADNNSAAAADTSSTVDTSNDDTSTSGTQEPAITYYDEDTDEDADPDGEDSLNLRTVYLQSEDGETVEVTEQTNGDYYFRDENGTGFTDNGGGKWSDEYGNVYTEE